jgi:hypothetical protein
MRFQEKEEQLQRKVRQRTKMLFEFSHFSENSDEIVSLKWGKGAVRRLLTDRNKT